MNLMRLIARRNRMLRYAREWRGKSVAYLIFIAEAKDAHCAALRLMLCRTA